MLSILFQVSRQSFPPFLQSFAELLNRHLHMVGDAAYPFVFRTSPYVPSGIGILQLLRSSLFINAMFMSSPTYKNGASPATAGKTPDYFSLVFEAEGEALFLHGDEATARPSFPAIDRNIQRQAGILVVQPVGAQVADDVI